MIKVCYDVRKICNCSNSRSCSQLFVKNFLFNLFYVDFDFIMLVLHFYEIMIVINGLKLSGSKSLPWTRL